MLAAQHVASRDDEVDRADDHHRDQADERHAECVSAECVDRVEDAAAHEERAHDRERPGGEHQRDVPDLEHPALLLDHQRMQECGTGQPWHQRRVLDGIPTPVATPAELRIGPQGAEQDPGSEEQPRGEREASDRFDPLGVDPARQQRTGAERERDRAQRVAGVQHRRVDHHRREAQQRVETDAFRRHRMRGRKRVGVEDHQRHEEPAEAEHDRGRVGGDVAQALACQEQREAAPHRHQPRPQQQRAFLRGPHCRSAIQRRRRAAGGVRDRVEREVVAQERELEHDERGRQDAGERVHRAPARFRELHAAGAYAV